MNILISAHDFIPLTGGGKYPFSLANELAARGHRVGIFWAKNKPKNLSCYSLHENVIYREYNYRCNSSVSRINTPDPVFMSATEELNTAFGTFLDELKPDICHFMHFEQQSMFFISECAKRNIPCVMTFLDSFLYCIKFTPLKRVNGKLNLCLSADRTKCTECFAEWFSLSTLPETPMPDAIAKLTGDVIDARKQAVKLLLSGIGQFISPSRHLAESHVRNLDIDRNRIHIIPHGIQKRRTLQKGPDAKRTVFGFVGGVLESKGHNDLLKVFSGTENVALKIWGPAAPVAKSGTVEYCGQYKPEDIDRIMSEIDVYIHPSYYENCPLSVREALTYGKPVISYDNPGACEILEHDNNAILCKTGDTEELLSAVHLMSDRVLRDRISANALKTHIADFSAEVDAILDVYKQTKSSEYQYTEASAIRDAVRERILLKPMFQGFTNHEILHDELLRSVDDVWQLSDYETSYIAKKVPDFDIKRKIWLDICGNTTISDKKQANESTEPYLCSFMNAKKIFEFDRAPYIYGAGDAGRKIMMFLKHKGTDTAAFLDDNKSGQWCGIPVKKPEEAVSDTPVIFACASYTALINMSHMIKKTAEHKAVAWFVEPTALFNGQMPFPVFESIYKLAFYCSILTADNNAHVELYCADMYAVNMLTDFFGLDNPSEICNHSDKIIKAANTFENIHPEVRETVNRAVAVFC